MKKIIVASKNIVKINATLRGFQDMFPNGTFEIEGVSVPSNVSEQPKSDQETFQGALNRVENAMEEIKEADFWVGLEGGIEVKGEEMEEFTWVVIRSKDGKTGKGKSGTFFLPPKIVELIQQGKELGEAVDMVFGSTNAKQQNGAVGILTGDVIDRTKYCTVPVVMALIPFKNERFY